MIRVGPAGWSYRDWNGVVYPANPSRNFDRLAWISKYFDTVEVNASFYHIPAPRMARSWADRVPRDFLFSVKLHRSFTHEPGFPSARDVASFRDFLGPLERKGVLGAMLIQFPWSRRNDEEARDRILRIFNAFEDLPKAVEVRHASFDTGEFRSFLADHNVAIVNIDQPLHADSISPGESVTSDIAYVRLHGRNYEKWFRHDEAWERYDYLYSSEELSPWVDRVQGMRAREIFVITNNHFRGQAVVNALQIRSALGQPTEVPEPLARAYPAQFGEENPEPQGRLFPGS
jgi:uncharacterized protein YecE (DUF72 family)